MSCPPLCECVVRGDQAYYHATAPGDSIVRDDVHLLFKALQLGATNPQAPTHGGEEGLHEQGTDICERNDPEGHKGKVVGSLGVLRCQPALVRMCGLFLNRIRELDHAPAELTAVPGSQKDGSHDLE